jgi:hypothetical protein
VYGGPDVVRGPYFTQPCPRTYNRAVSLKWIDVSEMRTSSTIALTMEELRTSETTVYFNETTRRYFHRRLFVCHLHICVFCSSIGYQFFNSFSQMRAYNTSCLLIACTRALYSRLRTLTRSL